MSRVQDRIADYLRDKLDQLEGDRFRVIEDEEFDGKTFRAVARRTRNVGIGGTEEIIFVFASFTRLTSDKMADFTEDAYAYGKGTRKSSGPLGLLWVYPVALAEEASDSAVDRVRDESPRIQGFGYVAFPVVYDAAEDQLYFYDRGSGPLAGQGISKVARVARECLSLD